MIIRKKLKSTIKNLKDITLDQSQLNALSYGLFLYWPRYRTYL